MTDEPVPVEQIDMVAAQEISPTIIARGGKAAFDHVCSVMARYRHRLAGETLERAAEVADQEYDAARAAWEAEAPGPVAIACSARREAARKIAAAIRALADTTEPG